MLSPRTRTHLPAPECLHARRRTALLAKRHSSTASASAEMAASLDASEFTTSSQPSPSFTDPSLPPTKITDRKDFMHLPSPPPFSASNSARLAALHARLSLSPRLPLETLARCLVDPTADGHLAFNNSSLAILGHDLLGAHAAELVLCTYPRLPMRVVFAAVEARIGAAALAGLAREWGVEHAGQPGGEVDAGLLQYAATVHPAADPTGAGVLARDMPELARRKVWPWTPGVSRASVLDSVAGDHEHQGPLRPEVDYAERPELRRGGESAAPGRTRVSPSDAASGFVRAVFGAVYLHGGRAAAKAFFNAHIASRQLDVARLFEFRQPTRDLSKLCAREGFEAPIARILSETGRHSRTPVFVVGVFSGSEKLGEGSGGSLAEARIRACIAALKGWYLYSPVEVRVPSDVEGGGGDWKPVLVDGGEVIV